MQYTTSIVFTKNEVETDDIDRLFSKLEVVVPPANFITRVMSSVVAYTQSINEQEEVTEPGRTYR